MAEIPERYRDLFQKKGFAHLATVGADGSPQRYVQVRGRVAEITEQGADAHIDALAKKYLGQDRYPNRRPGEVRVLYKILPERVQTAG